MKVGFFLLIFFVAAFAISALFYAHFGEAIAWILALFLLIQNRAQQTRLEHIISILSGEE